MRKDLDRTRAAAHARGREAGSSLVEVMVALAASAVVIGALLSGVVALNAQRKLREERILAQIACRNVLEELRRTSIEDLPAADGRGFAVPGIGGTGSGLACVPGDPDGLPGEVRVVPERVWGGEVLYRVTAVVEWRRGRGSARAQLTTLMGRRR
ncbi:MAG TPA: type II secretion system protein [Planctomycetota bacterium]|nr:type II secretion system protein [Planctomycetota bacterium]